MTEIYSYRDYIRFTAETAKIIIGLFYTIVKPKFSMVQVVPQLVHA